MSIEMEHIKNTRGEIIDKLCHIGDSYCRNNGKVCNCNCYSGNPELPLMFRN